MTKMFAQGGAGREHPLPSRTQPLGGSATYASIIVKIPCLYFALGETLGVGLYNIA